MNAKIKLLAEKLLLNQIKAYVLNKAKNPNFDNEIAETPKIEDNPENNTVFIHILIFNINCFQIQNNSEEEKSESKSESEEILRKLFFMHKYKMTINKDEDIEDIDNIDNIDELDEEEIIKMPPLKRAKVVELLKEKEYKDSTEILVRKKDRPEAFSSAQIDRFLYHVKNKKRIENIEMNINEENVFKS